jgi:polysaccharide export outer membrane protein
LLLALLGAPSFALAGAAGAAEPPSAPGPEPAALADTYHISPGDTLYIAVEGEEQFTGEVQVSAAGTISYPLLGDVPAAGTTCTELRATLQGRLAQFLRHPSVMVTVRRYGQIGSSVYVMGEVKSAGVYPLAGDSGVMPALAAAGGLTDLASGEITILKFRTGESRTVPLAQLSEGAGRARVLLEPGDVILVNRKEDTRYAVLGEVPTPGMFDMPLQGRVRVLDAMTSAGLLTPTREGPGGKPVNILDDPTRTADLEHARLTRGETQTPLDLAALLRGDTSQNLVLHPGDVLTIPRRDIVQVYALGEVRSPGRQSLPTGATVLDLLNAAGGTTAQADPPDGRILRLVDGVPTSAPLDVGALLSGADPEQNPVLEEGDVLFVPAKGETNRLAGRVLSLLPYFLF